MPDGIKVDFADFTLGELEEIERETGFNISAASGDVPVRALVYMIFVVQRRANPAYTIDDARGVKLTAIQVVSGDAPDPTTRSPIPLNEHSPGSEAAPAESAG